MTQSIRPGASVVAVTPSNTVDIATLNGNYPRALFFGTAGNAVVVAPDGTSATFAVLASQLLPVQAKRVNSTSTTATGIIALY